MKVNKILTFRNVLHENVKNARSVNNLSRREFFRCIFLLASFDSVYK